MSAINIAEDANAFNLCTSSSEAGAESWSLKKKIETSKALSKILRHQAGNMGVSMDASGRVLLSDLLKLPDFRSVTVEDIILIVESCDKQRFSLSQQEETGSLMIRANQGHTLTGLEVDKFLESLSIERVMEITNGTGQVYHGTYNDVLPIIQSEGLCRMDRNHVHFATAYDGSVLSGMRKTCEVVVAVDVVNAMEEGLVFYRSANGVILCAGSGERGIIAPKFFSEVIKLHDDK